MASLLYDVGLCLDKFDRHFLHQKKRHTITDNTDK